MLAPTACSGAVMRGIHNGRVITWSIARGQLCIGAVELPPFVAAAPASYPDTIKLARKRALSALLELVAQVNGSEIVFVPKDTQNHAQS